MRYGLKDMVGGTDAPAGRTFSIYTDFGPVELPPKIQAMLQRIDAHLSAQTKSIMEQWVEARQPAFKDLDDGEG